MSLYILNRLAFIILSSTISFFPYCQTIDSLHNDEQVLSFIRGLREEYKNYGFLPSKQPGRHNPYQEKAALFGALTYEKADFDHNGHMDLLFNGYAGYGYTTTLVVLSFGRDSFPIRDLSSADRFALFVAKTVTFGGLAYIKTLLGTFKWKDNGRVASYHQRIDTLAWAFDEFIERTKPCACSIEKVQFCVGGGLGFFVMRQIEVRPGSAILELGQAVHPGPSIFDSGGLFVAKIDSATSARIFEILRYINFPHLKSRYEVGWTDQLTGQLAILYNIGKIKEISDYGLIGTFGLAAVERILLSLCTTQHWKRIRKETDGFFICDFFNQ
jgi:hypothetical protein